MHIRVDEDVLGRSGFGNVIPDLETSTVLRPTGVLLNDLLGHLGAIGVAESIDHANFERDVQAITLVYLIDHLDCIGPVPEISMCIRCLEMQYLQTNEVEANACDSVDDVFHRLPLQAFRNHCLA